MVTEKRSDRITDIPSVDLERINRLLHSIGGSQVSWGAASVLEVWLAETRLEAERLSSRRLLIATWVLAFATLGLVVATIALVIVAP